jgi:hypothetical protein
MKKIILITLLFNAQALFAQYQNSISTIDFVKIKNEKRNEALFFYENNWKIYRDIAIAKDFIKSYKLISTSSDSTANFDLLLITEYKDSIQYNLREERFQKIIKEINPNGPKLLNNFKPSDFRINLFYKEANTIFSSDERNLKRNKKDHF